MARAPALQAGGRRFDSDYLHKEFDRCRTLFLCPHSAENYMVILAQRKIPVDLHFLHHRHKAGGARRKSIDQSINSTFSPRGKARLEAVEGGSEGLSALCGTSVVPESAPPSPTLSPEHLNALSLSDMFSTYYFS